MSVTAEPSFVHCGSIYCCLRHHNVNNLKLTAIFNQANKYLLRSRPRRVDDCLKVYVNCCDTFWLYVRFERTVTQETLDSCQVDLHFFDFKHPHLHWFPDVKLGKLNATDCTVEIPITVHRRFPCHCAMLLRVFFEDDIGKERTTSVQVSVSERP